MTTSFHTERFHTVIVGGGQAGLSAGYHVARQGLPFVILDAHPRIGDAWRTRWDSLRLFTAARYDGLDGMPFPAAPHSFPTKDAMADYLETYAIAFRLPVRNNVRVDRLVRDGDRYVLTAGDRRFEAEHVIIAMANYQQRYVPAFARDLDPAIVQLHSSEYRNPSQLRPGGVLIVGGGNSGAELAMEAVRAGHQTWISGRETGQVPFNLNSPSGHLIVAPLVLRVLFHRVMTVNTAPGRKMRAKMLSQGGPLIRTKTHDLAAAGVERVPRTVDIAPASYGAQAGRPRLVDGRVLDAANVIWCTGFEAGTSWIDLPIFDEHGEPRQVRGLVENEPGLYFVGRKFLYAMSSSMIHGVGRDAAYVAATIAARTAEARQTEARQTEARQTESHQRGRQATARPPTARRSPAAESHSA